MRCHMRDRLVLMTVMLAGSVICMECANARHDSRAQPADPELLHGAMHQLTDVIAYDILNPPQAGRVYAYASIAAYEALRPAYPAYRTLAGQLNGLTPPPAPAPDSPHYLPPASLRPLVMASGSQFPPKPALAFDLGKASPYYRQVKEVFETVRHLTDEQRAMAQFWDDNAFIMHVQGHAMFATKKATPGGHWMGITAIAARKARADLMQSAEAYMRTAIAVADAFISCWDEKYRSNRIRPETVINASLHEQWEPLLQTPPFPEYPSGHSALSAAVAVVLTDQFGAGFAFVDSTEVEYGPPARAFTSFQQAAAEAAISRLYGGDHYPQAIKEGAVDGRRGGELVLGRVRAAAA